MEAFFVSTGVVALAEAGDKTQVATVAMATHYANPLWVVMGTTLGMLIADVPAKFAVLGVATLLGAGAGFGF